MPTTQKTRTKTELTLQQSTLLVQNCAKSFVSMITYLRDIFPAESYESKSYAGAKFRSLKNISEEGEDGSSNKLLRFLEGDVYEMIEAGHLEHLMLAIYQKNTGELLEQYLLKISTATESKPFAIEISKKLNASDKRKSKFQLEKANIGTFLFCSLFTIFPLSFFISDFHHHSFSFSFFSSPLPPEANFRKIVRGIQAMSETQQPLPSDVDVKLVVVLREDAPRDADQNLTSFSNFTGNQSELRFPKNVEALHIKLGEVTTAHHKISVKMRIKDEDVLPEEEETFEMTKNEIPNNGNKEEEEEEEEEDLTASDSDDDFEDDALPKSHKKRKRAASPDPRRITRSAAASKRPKTSKFSERLRKQRKSQHVATSIAFGPL